MNYKKLVKSFFRGCGFDLVKLSPACHPLAQRKQLLKYFSIDTVIDVGANNGQFALQLRNELNYRGRIVSFEPLKDAYAEMEKHAARDDSWKVFNAALGDSVGESLINIAGNSTSSSLLEMLPKHIESAPASKYVGTEVISVKTLDSVFGDICGPSDSIYLKIDTQGFESKVLKGALGSLPRVKLIQMEMTLVPLYQNEVTFTGMYNYMVELGFDLIGVEQGFAEVESGRLLQLDGTFLNSRASH